MRNGRKTAGKNPQVDIIKFNIDRSRYKLVGLKSSTHFRAGFAPYASDIITADEPGLASGRLEVFEGLREHAPATPHWPVASGAAYEGVAAVAEDLARL